jgi:rod shape-determining protein MreC
MESLITRYRNVSILVAILFAQVLGLAVQVRRSPDSESSRLIRVWAVSAVTPVEKGIVWTQSGMANLWRNYVYLRGVRQENRDLKYELERLRLEQVRLTDDAEQARRLQALLGFKEQFISKTVAAQVIGWTGSELSRGVYIDKGDSDGVKRDMAVITADGVVGKVLHVYENTSLVLLIDDQTSGVGALLEKSRLQGILRGTPAGEIVMEKVLADETVEPGEKILTSGGDQIFAKGLPAGTVASVSRGPESFLNIRVRPSADLGKLEEVLVITQKEEKVPVVDRAVSPRAADILAQRLPSVPDKPPVPTVSPAVGTTGPPGAATSPKAVVPASGSSVNGSRGNAQPANASPATPSQGATRKPASPVAKPLGDGAQPTGNGSQTKPTQPEAGTPQPADKPQ